MPIKANTFVWINEPSPGAKPEKKTTGKPLADDFPPGEKPKNLAEEPPANAEFIPLSDDGTFKVKRSQYTEDMMGDESANNINTTQDNKKE